MTKKESMADLAKFVEESGAQISILEEEVTEKRKKLSELRQKHSTAKRHLLKLIGSQPTERMPHGECTERLITLFKEKKAVSLSDMAEYVYGEATAVTNRRMRGILHNINNPVFKRPFRIVRDGKLYRMEKTGYAQKNT